MTDKKLVHVMMLSCKRSFRFWYALVKGKWDNCYEWNYTPGWNILLNALNIVKPPLLTNPLFPCKYPKPNRMLIFIWNTLAKNKGIHSEKPFGLSNPFKFRVQTHLWMWLLQTSRPCCQTQPHQTSETRQTSYSPIPSAQHFQ